MEPMSASAQPAASPSLSSLAASSNATHSASNPHSTHQASGGRGPSSLSLIGSANAARVRLTQDFHSLVRSNSTSATTRYDRWNGRPRRTASVQVRPGTADARQRNLSPHAPLLHKSAVENDLDMTDKPREESRIGRSFGARLVNFLSKSRSRSRSKKRRSRSLGDIVVPVDQMPTKQLQAGSLGRHNPYNTLEDSTNTSNSTSTTSGSKPITRSPSRPLSGATTATDTTVKGHLQKSPRAQEKSPELPPPQAIRVQAEMLGSHAPEPAGKAKKANIFSVSIVSPRKRSSGDSSISARVNGSSSPIPADHTGRSLWSGRFRSGSGSSAGGQSSRSNVGEPSTLRESPPPLPPKPSTSSKAPRSHVVAPMHRPARHDTITTLNSPPPPYQYEYEGHSTSDLDLAGRCSPLCGLPSPRLTPVSEKGKEKERVREREKEREKEQEAGHQREREKERERSRSARDRPTDLSRRPTDRRKAKEKEITSPRRVGSPVVRERERESRVAIAQVAAAPMEKVASGGSGNSKKSKESIGANAVRVKRTKHGSFDFERPVSGPNGAPNMRTALRGLGIATDFHGDLAQPIERTTSAKEKGSSRHHGPSHPQSASQPNSYSRSTKRPTVDVNASTLVRHTREHSQDTSNPNSTSRSHFNHSDFIPATPHSSQSGSGKSSSLGKSGGARMHRGAHGAFKFEPAVPPIPGSPASDDRTTPAGRGLNHSASPSKLRQEHVTAKGRSLDLGLSLSWAPQRVREEAVLSYNQSAGSAHATTSRVHTRWRGGTVDEQGRLDAPSSKSASNVAEAFKEALGDAAYRTFKTYVHRFDAHAIPLEGPYGLISAASRLLDNAGTLDERRKKALLDRFIRFVRENQ